MAEDDRQNKVIFKQMVQNLKTGQALTEQAQKSVQAVSGHVKEVLGPFGEAADFLKETAGNVGNFFKGIGQDLGLLAGGQSVEDKQLDESEKQTGVLESILDSLVADKKAEFVEGLGKKEKKTAWGMILGIFGAIAFAIGAALGGVVRSIVLPFEVLYKGLRFVFGGIIKKIGDVFGGIFRFFMTIARQKKLTELAKKGDKVIDFFKGIGRFFGRFKKIFTAFKPVTAIFKKFAAGFARGFKILGWPLTILMGVIDFIKGFMATEGDILAKIQGGVTASIQGFFELPAKIFGWVIDKILGIFGTEIEGGAASKILSGINWLVEQIFKFIRNPFDILMAGVKGISDWFQDLWNGLMDGLISMARKVDFIPGVKGLIKGAEALKFDKAGAGDEVGAAEEQRRAAMGIKEAEKKQIQKDTLAEQKAMGKKLDGVAEGQEAQTNVIVASTTKKEPETKEPPSGIQESAGLWLETITF
jgi:hypothetical protein